jgi:hypothetical protein
MPDTMTRTETQRHNALANTATRTLIEAARTRAYDEALGHLRDTYGAANIPPFELKLEILRRMRDSFDVLVRALEVEL